MKIRYGVVMVLILSTRFMNAETVQPISPIKTHKIYESGFIYSGWTLGYQLDEQVEITKSNLEALGFVSVDCHSELSLLRGVDILCDGTRAHPDDK